MAVPGIHQAYIEGPVRSTPPPKVTKTFISSFFYSFNTNSGTIAAFHDPPYQRHFYSAKASSIALTPAYDKVIPGRRSFGVRRRP